MNWKNWVWSKKNKNIIGLGSTLTDVKNSVRNYVNVYDTYEMETDKGICLAIKEEQSEWKEWVRKDEAAHISCDICLSIYKIVFWKKE